MSNDLNQCSFIGRLGADPETRYAPSGDCVTSFSVAVGSQWKDKQTGEKKESTEWVNIVAWRGLGEICGQYLRKGSQVFIQGRMKTEKYEKDGITRYSTKIEAETMQMLGSKREGGENESAASQSSAPARKPAAAATGGGDFSDDIPFLDPYKFTWRIQ